MKKNLTYLFVVFSLIFSSCEDIINVKLSDTDVDLYAVEGKITTVNNPYVFLYKSQTVYTDETYSGISGAIVTISDNSQPVKSIELKESPERKGLYLPEAGSHFLGKPGKKYTVRILVNNVELTASDELNPVVPIDSIQVHSSLRGDNRFLGIFTYGNETPGTGDYYKWDIYINNRLLVGTDNLVIASDELVDGNYINGFEIFTDFHDPNKPEDRIINLGDTVQVGQTSISEFAYNFYYQMFNQGQTGGIFSVPPANIEGNFTSSDGREVLGLFTAHDVSISNKVIIDDKIEEQLKE